MDTPPLSSPDQKGTGLGTGIQRKRGMGRAAAPPGMETRTLPRRRSDDGPEETPVQRMLEAHHIALDRAEEIITCPRCGGQGRSYSECSICMGTGTIPASREQFEDANFVEFEEELDHVASMLSGLAKYAEIRAAVIALHARVFVMAERVRGELGRPLAVNTRPGLVAANADVRAALALRDRVAAKIGVNL